MRDNPFVIRFTQRDGAHRVCTVCRDADGQHEPTCPLMALDTEVRELAFHIGLCVANIKDSLEAIGRLLRDEGRRDEGDHT